MASTVTTWRDGRIVDGAAVPARPWSFVLGLLGLVLLLDWGIALTFALAPEPADVDVRDRLTARVQLQRAAQDESAPWLLVGDSVLAGDVMRGKVEGWEHQRVIDAMRAQVNPDAGVRFHQVALDAMLPVDMLHLVRELDAFDPGARVPVAIELNPRYFSRSYADLAECTRPWLCELGPAVLDKAPNRVARLAQWFGTVALDGIAEHTPILRHRWRLPTEGLRAGVGAVVARPPEGEPDALAGRARILAHYQGLRLDGRSKQIQALEALVARLRATGRRAVFFTTPLEDGFAAAAMDGQALGAYVARMSRIVEGGGGDRVTLVNLDHPLFASTLFLDHCHLGPEGNRRLALNLLVELGLGVAEVPPDEALVHLEGPDRTLVARTDLGYSDGAAWQAMFDVPHGIAVAPGGGRIVVADTGNHVLRELSGAMQTVRVVAGVARQAGHGDGVWHQAKLDEPTDPVLQGDTVYFADQKRTAVRRLQGGKVATLQVLQGPKWKRIDALVGDGPQLLVLDGGRRVLGFDPIAGVTVKLLEAAAGSEIRAIAPTGDGRLFVADQANRIWVGELGTGDALVLGRDGGGLELEFANTAPSVMPQVRGLYFPLEYDELALGKIVGMTWVQRYGALLIQDDLEPAKRNEALTERIQLRLLDPQDDRFYPWLRPLVHGGGYMLYNKKTDSFVSYFHEGTMALDQATATTYWLERGRSRLFHFADGVLGVAKIGHIRDLDLWGFRDLLGVESGTETLAALRPDRFLSQRIEPHPRSGPYFGLVIGSSMLSKADNIGSYSFTVRLERRLRHALGYRDGIGIDLVQRSYPGVRSEHVLQHLRGFVDSGAQIDVLFVELSGRRRGFFLEDNSEARMRAVLAEIDAIARRHDTKVVFFDDSALVSAGRDGLRRGIDEYRKFKAMAREAGFEVVELTDELLRAAMDLSPFGSPPWRSHHGAPWAIDAAADLLGDRVYPPLREFLRGRVPAHLRPPVTEDPVIAALADAFIEVQADWATLLPPLGGESVQSVIVGDRLQIFVDLARIEVDPADTAALEEIALRALHEVIATEGAGARARSVELRLATFSRYDEYGAGVRDAATVVLQRELDRAGLEALLRARVQR